MGRYRIIGLIGRGGMGEVYRADDLRLGQPVALKFLPKALSEDSVRRERLYAEVRIARQISHPNICRVYDIGEIDGQHFLTMEFIDGEDLASLLQRIGHLHAAKALDVARQLCYGLAAASCRDRVAGVDSAEQSGLSCSPAHAGKAPGGLGRARERDFEEGRLHRSAPADSAWGIDPDADYLQYVREHDVSAARFVDFPDSAVRFWYRQSPRSLDRVNFNALFSWVVPSVTSDDPPLQFSGEALLFPDRGGRLLDLAVVPPRREETSAPIVPADWRAVFTEADLDPAKWTVTQPGWTPPFYADARTAWTGTIPGDPEIPLRIEAASFHGKPVSFEVVAPWTDLSLLTDAGSSSGRKKAQRVLCAALSRSRSATCMSRC